MTCHAHQIDNGRVPQDEMDQQLLKSFLEQGESKSQKFAAAAHAIYVHLKQDEEKERVAKRRAFVEAIQLYQPKTRVASEAYFGSRSQESIILNSNQSYEKRTSWDGESTKERSFHPPEKGSWMENIEMHPIPMILPKSTNNQTIFSESKWKLYPGDTHKLCPVNDDDIRRPDVLSGRGGKTNHNPVSSRLLISLFTISATILIIPLCSFEHSGEFVLSSPRRIVPGPLSLCEKNHQEGDHAEYFKLCACQQR